MPLPAKQEHFQNILGPPQSPTVGLVEKYLGQRVVSQNSLGLGLTHPREVGALTAVGQEEGESPKLGHLRGGERKKFHSVRNVTIISHPFLSKDDS